MTKFSGSNFGFFVILFMVIVNYGVLALLLVMGLLLLMTLFNLRGRRVNVKPLLISLVSPFVFIAVSIFTIYFHQDNVKFVMYAAIFIYLMAVVMAVLFFYEVGLNDLSNALSKFIYITFILLVFQHLMYLFFNYYVDVHKVITVFNVDSRYFSTLLLRFGLIRPTGWTVEPSNMGAIITFCTVLYYLINKKVDRVLKFGLCGSIITFSFAAIVIAVVIISVISLRHLSPFRVLFLSTPILGGLCYFVYYRMTGGVDYDAFGMRVVIIEAISSQDIYNLLFGNGFFALSSPLNLSGTYIYDYNIRDSGVWINLLFSIGLIPLVFLFLILYFLIKNLSDFFIVVAAMSSKFDYFQPFFWFFILLLFGYYLGGIRLRGSVPITSKNSSC